MEVRLPFLRSGVTYLLFFEKTLKTTHTYNLFYHLFITTMMKDIREGMGQKESPFCCGISTKLKTHQQFYFVSWPMEVYDYSPQPTGNQFSNTANSFHKGKLWNDSQATIKFVSPFLSFSREKRFKWSSIYWPENDPNSLQVVKKGKSEIHEAAKKISKMIDEQEKNEERMKQIKRTLSIGKSQISNVRKQSHSVLSTKKPFKLSKQTQKIVIKLASNSSRKQSLLRDRHGNRCNMFQDPQAQSQTTALPRFLCDSTGFKTSRKVKLDLPHNYYPGPGSYEIKRYLSELEGKPQIVPLNTAATLQKIASK